MTLSIFFSFSQNKENGERNTKCGIRFKRMRKIFFTIFSFLDGDCENNGLFSLPFSTLFFRFFFFFFGITEKFQVYSRCGIVDGKLIRNCRGGVNFAKENITRSNLTVPIFVFGSANSLQAILQISSFSIAKVVREGWRQTIN